MITAIIIMTVLFITCLAVACNSDKQTLSHVAGTSSAVIGTALFGTILTLIVNYKMAAKNQSIINKYAPIVKHYEDYVNKLEHQLKGIKQPKPLTINHDTPVKSLTEAYFKAQEILLEAKTKVGEAKVKQEEIRLGPFSVVVSWVETE